MQDIFDALADAISAVVNSDCGTADEKAAMVLSAFLRASALNDLDEFIALFAENDE